MATIKVKFRDSSVGNKPGSIYYQVIHGRVTRQINTSYKIYASEWDGHSEAIKADCIIGGIERGNYLRSCQERMSWDLRRLQKVVSSLNACGIRYSADDVVREFQRLSDENSLFGFIHSQIAEQRRMGKNRTAETYAATFASFKTFRKDEDVPLDGIDSDLMKHYQSWLLARGLKKNTCSFYMRILRAVYNRAVEKGLTPQNLPFRHVYTGIDKTMKRAVSIDVIKRLRTLDLSHRPSLEFARDMFLFSFYTRGMSYIDMANLKKSDLNDGYLTYCRRKTGQRLTVKWEKRMQEIVDKHPNPANQYLLPIIRPQVSARRDGKLQGEQTQYLNSRHLTNYYLKSLSKDLGISPPLTMYVARHSWASIAKQKNIPLSVISDGMGHDSESTTRIYLASLSNTVIDEANRLIIDDV